MIVKYKGYDYDAESDFRDEREKKKIKFEVIGSGFCINGQKRDIEIKAKKKDLPMISKVAREIFKNYDVEINR